MSSTIFYIVYKNTLCELGVFCICGDGGIGHELLTIIVRYAPILVSTLDPSSASLRDMPVLFNSRRKARRRFTPSPQIVKAPCGAVTICGDGEN